MGSVYTLSTVWEGVHRGSEFFIREGGYKTRSCMGTSEQ